MIRRRPVLSFFVLATVLSWLAWIPYILSRNGIGIWDHRFPEIFGSGQVGLLPGLYLGPIGSAFVVTAVADGRTGLRRWVGRMWRWRVGGRWYAGTLLGVPALILVAGALFAHGDVRAPSAVAVAAYVPALVLQLVTTGLGEEPGWRDFALPRMQHRLGALRAALVLGPLWAVWHLPLFLTDWGGWPTAHWSRPVLFVVFCIAFTVVLSWIFNRTGESLPMAMLAHCSVNNVASVLWAEMFPALTVERALLATTVAATSVAAVLLIATGGRLGYRRQDCGSLADRAPRNRLPA